MSTDLVPVSGESPFDRDRHVRADGSEYWLARELMALAEYERWENFRGVIGKAMTAAETPTSQYSPIFVSSRRMSRSGSVIVSSKISRSPGSVAT